MNAPTPQAAPPTPDERAQAIAGLIVNVQAAAQSVRNCAPDLSMLEYGRNRQRMQAISIQLYDLTRELNYELRRAELAAAPEAIHGDHS